MVGEEVLAQQAISSFAGEGGILGLIILALLAIVGLVVWVSGGYMRAMLKAHEDRLDKNAAHHKIMLDEQEARHRTEREAAEHRWQSVTREISTDIKEAFAVVSSQNLKITAAVERFDSRISKLKKAA